MKIDVDDVLETVGSIGPFQLRRILILALFTVLANPTMTLIVAFTAAEPPWRCADNSTICISKGVFKPGVPGYDSRCTMPRKEWEFIEGFTSIVTEWDLVCTKSLQASLAKSMVFAGWLPGVLLFGIASDKFGRKPVVFISSMVACAGCLISAFVPSLWLYVLFRLVSGIGVGGSFLSMFILCAEFAGVRHRALTSVLYGTFWHVGTHILPLIAWLLPDWKELSIAMSVPGMFILIFWKCLSESPRWLLLEGRTDEAGEVLEKVAKENNKPMPKGELGLKVPKVENSKNGNILDLFKSWQVTKITLIMFLCWFSVALQTYGTTFFSVSLPGNMYVNFLLASLPGIPGCFYCAWAANRFGRKKATAFSFLAPSILCGLMAGLQGVAPNAVGLVLFLLVKFFSFSCFGFVYLVGAEVFPTMIRNVGMGACSAVARVGGFVAPYIIWLQRVHVALPMTIMGSCTLASAILLMTINETNMAPTPETTTEFGQLKEIDSNGFKAWRWSTEIHETFKATPSKETEV